MTHPRRAERSARLSLAGLCLLLAAATASHLSPARVLAQVDPELRARAAAHFDRGIEFFNEHRYDAALAELARAYALAPAHQTLYNLARVHAALGHPVEAAHAYARYLEEAEDAITPARRREAELALALQRRRIGRLLVRTDVPGATLAIDGVDVATAPTSEPIELGAGSHIVELRAPGHESARRSVAIAGEDTTQIEITLRAQRVPRGALSGHSSIPETAITVDGEDVGLTPLSTTLPLSAGEHVIRAARLGYRAQSQTVEIRDGAEAELNFEMRREPSAPPEHLGRVHLLLPSAPFRVLVDQEPTLGVDLELPIGAHTVSIEVTDRRPYEGTIRVQAGRRLEITPPLTWTLEARREQRLGAAAQQTAGISLSVGGAGLLLAGGVVLIWNETEISRTDDRLRFINGQLRDCRAMGFDRECDALEAEGIALTSDQDTQNVLRGISVTSAVLGAALGGLGVVLWQSSRSDQEIDAAAHARLVIGVQGLRIDGGF